ncbi:triphosphate tunnel metalloenzyme 3 isoform X2 [Helianthus annuus]|uniref:triphosphate tunnel metalloenzyme 3 isoform X2 n=1 Tax=Helianthus annuus TaxID=4232 RepID=UPI000B901DC4|nr:triphosphate tunnel metalloenzyme 3 isoform X2 [Helianthus annuus]
MMSPWIKNLLRLSFSSSSQISHKFPMEIEIKLRLPDSAAHQKLSDILSLYHTKTHLQQNLFFDTPQLTLATTHLAALRLRFYDLDTQSILSLKSKPKLSNGISRIEEIEHPLDPTLARACAAEPRRFSAVQGSGVLERVVGEFGVGLDELVCLGGFRNVRAVYIWNGLKVELDESEYEFGVCYEVECESDRPEEVKVMLEELLERNGIRFCYSKMSKFAVFRSGKLPEFGESDVGRVVGSEWD